MPIKKICVITGSRADYGLLFCLIKKLNKDPDFELILIATGSHLNKKYGETKKQIISDGFEINFEVDILLDENNDHGVAKSTGIGVVKFSDIYASCEPDAILILGDRFEILSAAIAAYFQKIPIIHLHGGEVTYGSLDDGTRHAITKLSNYHFVAAKEYAKRVHQLGEDIKNIFIVGAPGLELCNIVEKISLDTLGKKLGTLFEGPYLLITYHPETNMSEDIKEKFKNLLLALSYFNHFKLIFTASNSDAGGDVINELIQDFVNKHTNSCFFKNLGSLFYINILKYASAIVGNSSSGIIEAPFLSTPTVNIGCRQKGRLLAASIVNTDYSVENIKNAIEKSLSDGFRRKWINKKNPYGDGATSEKIINILKSIDLEYCPKIFVDNYCELI